MVRKHWSPDGKIVFFSDFRVFSDFSFKLTEKGGQKGQAVAFRHDPHGEAFLGHHSAMSPKTIFSDAKCAALLKVHGWRFCQGQALSATISYGEGIEKPN